MTHPRNQRSPRIRAALASATLVSTLAFIAPVAGTPVTKPVAQAAAATCPSTNGVALRATPASYSKTVSLTFDDGPSKFTPQVLDVLAENGVRATFFVTGEKVQANPAIAKRIVAEGHVIANHTYTHPQAVTGSQPYGRFDSLSASVQRSQLDSTTSAIKTATGVTPCYFRGPGGWHWSTTTQDLAKARNLTIAHWTLSGEDSGQAATTTPTSTATIVRNSTTSHAHPIVLLHDGKASPEPESTVTSNRSNTVAALPQIIAHYKRNGYVFTDPRGRKLATSAPVAAPVVAKEPTRAATLRGSRWAKTVADARG